MQKKRCTTVLKQFLFFVFLPSLALASPPLTHDGFLRLYHSHTNEVLETRYEINGTPQEESLQKINHFMRSRDSGLEKPIDLELIRLLDHLQDHFGADTIEVISGYRSPEFNRQLKSIGRSVMDDSFHLSGSAVDFHIDEIDEKTIHSYLNRLWQGGLGIYPDNLMCHVDVGPYRRWQQGEFSNRRDIGIFNEESHLKLTTNKLFYKKGEKIKVTPPLPSEAILEHFFRGKWKKVDGPSLPYGKMRYKVFDKKGEWQNSNEFYLKKK